MEIPEPGTEQSFRERLDTFYDWPCGYLFKFIAPKDRLADLEVLFDDRDAQLSTRESKKGNYVSLSAETDMGSADDVIEIYRRAAEIEGVMAL
jgi:putative lipoic acid-binding regulatory protein